MESAGYCALTPSGRFFGTFRALKDCLPAFQTMAGLWRVRAGSAPTRQSEPPELPAVLEKKDPQEPQHHGLRRSRGRLTTKIRIACYSRGFPLAKCCRLANSLTRAIHNVAGSDQPAQQQGRPLKGCHMYLPKRVMTSRFSVLRLIRHAACDSSAQDTLQASTRPAMAV